jgi:hypothetical protein
MSTDTLRTIPGIGPSLAKDLRRLEYENVADLCGQDASAMYERLMKIYGSHIDRCVLYTFRCAVYFAEGGRAPEKLKWWNWKDQP